MTEPEPLYETEFEHGVEMFGTNYDAEHDADLGELDRESGLHIVLIEADGLQMPRKYYRRLRSLALRVRGDESQGPIARRVSENSAGVIFQEGAILCKSQSLARQIRNLAVKLIAEMDPAELEGRQPTVSIGRVQLDTQFTRTRQDVQIMNRVQNVLGKRGRRPDPTPWTITCMECGEVEEEETWQPVNCPACSGLLIHSRRGKPITYYDPGNIDVFELWARTRFGGAHWEPTKVVQPGEGGMEPPDTADLNFSGREEPSVGIIKDSADFLTTVRQMPRQQALDVLDGVFVNRTYRDFETRQRTRLEIAVQFMQAGGQRIDFSERPDRVDMVDAAGLISQKVVSGWLLTLEQNS